MAWIESHQTLLHHPKLLRLAKQLKIHMAQAIGHLHCLWWWALDYAPTGDISNLEPDELAIAARWDGEVLAFTEALANCNWVDPNGFLHDWQHYAGPCLMAKDRQKRYRTKRLEQRNGHVAGHVTHTVETTVEAMTTLPNLTKPNHTKPKEIRRFQRPSPKEVSTYGTAIGYKLNGQQFCDFYESKGWKVGNTPMKDWKAAVRTWKNKDQAPLSPIQAERAQISSAMSKADMERREEEKRQEEANALEFEASLRRAKAASNFIDIEAEARKRIPADVRFGVNTIMLPLKIVEVYKEWEVKSSANAANTSS